MKTLTAKCLRHLLTKVQKQPRQCICCQLEDWLEVDAEMFFQWLLLVKKK